MSEVLRIIDQFEKAEPGYDAIIALPQSNLKESWLPWKRKKVDFVLKPVLFWANMFLANGDTRGSSVFVAMVRHGDGIYPAPLIDGYVGLKTPLDKEVLSIDGIENAIATWRAQKQQSKAVAKERAQSMN